MKNPEIRFRREDGAEYPKWKEKKLGEITEKVKRIADNNSTAPVMMISQGNGFIYQSEKYSRDNAGQSLAKYTLLKYGEMAYNHGASKAKPYGVAYCLQEEKNARVPFVYHCFNIVNGIPKYWNYALNTFQMDRQLKKMVSSGVRMDGLLNISYDTYMQIKIAVPCTEEQKKIADFLSTVDEVINQSENEVKNLEKQKKGVMQKIFSQEVRFRRDDGAEYPQWEEKTLSELFDISAGGDIDKKNSSKYYSTAYPYAIYANALTNKGLYGYANYFKIEQDCFTVTGRGDVGFAVARHERFVPIVRLLVCIPKHNENVNCFAEIINNTNILVESTGVPQLTSIQLGKIRVHYPTNLEEQQKIADFLSAYDEAITCAKQELEKWKQLKKGLLQQMFI